MKINVNILKEHPLNKTIYGEEDEAQFNALVEKIRNSGWIKAVLITKDYLIISGHRRVRAAIALGIEAVECEIVDNDEEKQLEIFLNENAYRQKTTVQLIAEAEYYHEIESKKALQRQLAGVDLAVLKPQGSTNEIVGKKIGLSESAYAKARKVYKRMSEEEDPGLKALFGDTLNENIDAAAKLIEKPYAFLKEVGDRTYVDFKNVGKVIRELEQEEIKVKTNLPPGKYQILLLDLSNRIYIDLLNKTISGICEQDCVLFTWVLPHQVNTGIEISKNWGFRYATCLVWNRDEENELSDYGEICLVTVKGSPNFIFKHFPCATEKPGLLKKVIDIGYPGWSKVEIFKGDGWEIW